MWLTPVTSVTNFRHQCDPRQHQCDTSLPSPLWQTPSTHQFDDLPSHRRDHLYISAQNKCLHLNLSISITTLDISLNLYYPTPRNHQITNLKNKPVGMDLCNDRPQADNRAAGGIWTIRRRMTACGEKPSPRWADWECQLTWPDWSQCASLQTPVGLSPGTNVTLANTIPLQIISQLNYYFPNPPTRITRISPWYKT